MQYYGKGKNKLFHSIHRSIKKRIRHYELTHRLEARTCRVFRRRMGYALNLDHPKTLSEKIQWLKLYYHNPLLTLCADKVKVRGYVAKKIGEEYLTPVYGVYKNTSEIDISQLPRSFVLKPNHGSGMVIICHNKQIENWRENYNKLDSWISENFFYENGEWQYKDIPPRIMAEELLQGRIIDYGFFCFHGQPLLCNVMGFDDAQSHRYKEAFYDTDYHLLELHQAVAPEAFTKPACWEKMLEIARTLSADFLFVRVDLRVINGQIRFGELTFTPANGTSPFHPAGWDARLESHLHLEKAEPQFLIKQPPKRS